MNQSPLGTASTTMVFGRWNAEDCVLELVSETGRIEGSARTIDLRPSVLQMTGLGWPVKIAVQVDQLHSLVGTFVASGPQHVIRVFEGGGAEGPQPLGAPIVCRTDDNDLAPYESTPPFSLVRTRDRVWVASTCDGETGLYEWDGEQWQHRRLPPSLMRAERMWVSARSLTMVNDRVVLRLHSAVEVRSSQRESRRIMRLVGPRRGTGRILGFESGQAPSGEQVLAVGLSGSRQPVVLTRRGRHPWQLLTLPPVPGTFEGLLVRGVSLSETSLHLAVARYTSGHATRRRLALVRFDLESGSVEMKDCFGEPPTGEVPVALWERWDLVGLAEVGGSNPRVCTFDGLSTSEWLVESLTPPD